MNEQYLTIAEIEAKYPNEWVLLDKPVKKHKSLQVAGGRVLTHSADREEFDRQLLELTKSPELGDIAVFYTGKPNLDEVWLV
ncbi:MAG: hypothetical protein L0241_20515 [Planctomycetia bacterium]|nr:hypothetical protein [Planctomycetia bacterium]